MKATGVIRKIDQMGRFVIPKEIRDNLGIEEDTPLEIYVEGSKIVLQKYQPWIFTEDQLQEALNLVCRETGKDPVKYLERVKGELL